MSDQTNNRFYREAADRPQSYQSVYDELCEMFGKEVVDDSIAAAKGQHKCTCDIKGADKCQAKIHTRRG